MRKEPQSPWSSALDRVRAPWGRAWRWLANQGAATRVGLVLAGLAVVGSVGWLVSGEHAPGAPGAVPLYEGQRLSIDDLKAITSALDFESIAYLLDRPSRQVVVRTDRKSAALAAIEKRKAAPVSLGDLNRDDEPVSLWATPADRDRQERRRVEQSLKRQIELLDAPIISAQVTIIRDKARGTLSTRWNVHASVYLVIERGRKLGLRTVEGIEAFLLGALPDLKTDKITVTDQTGHKYMMAGDAPLKEQVRKQSQEEEWTDKINEGLRHIPNVRVTVLLESIIVAPPTPEEPPAAPATEVAVVNGSLEVAPEPRPVAAPRSPPIKKTRANVWVRIPRSFYLMAAQAQSPGRHPSVDDMQLMQTTTARIVREAVDASIPEDLRGGLTVTTVQDDLATVRTASMPADPEPGQLWPIPTIAASGVGLAVALSVVTGFRLASKRPAHRPASAWRPGFVADEPNPGPSERVRELIRLNPEAAAGVLQRWIGQGGAVG